MFFNRLNVKFRMMFFFAVPLCLLFSGGCADLVCNQYVLWYSQPASEWLQALPVGNGRLGAMVYGDTISERIQLNDDTIWAGPPVPTGNADFQKGMKKARLLWFDGKYIEAERMLQSVMGKHIAPRSYQTMGNLHLQLTKTSEVSNTYRNLNLDTAIATTRFEMDGVTYTREVFSSPVDDVLVVRFGADKPGQISLRATLDRPADFTTIAVGDNALEMFGQAQHNGSNLGVKWRCRLQGKVEKGNIRTEGIALIVEDADAVTLLLYRLAKDTQTDSFLADDPACFYSRNEGDHPSDGRSSRRAPSSVDPAGQGKLLAPRHGRAGQRPLAGRHEQSHCRPRQPR